MALVSQSNPSVLVPTPLFPFHFSTHDSSIFNPPPRFKVWWQRMILTLASRIFKLRRNFSHGARQASMGKQAINVFLSPISVPHCLMISYQATDNKMVYLCFSSYWCHTISADSYHQRGSLKKKLISDRSHQCVTVTFGGTELIFREDWPFFNL